MIPLYVEGNIDKLLFETINEFLSYRYFQYEKPFIIFKTNSVNDVLIRLSKSQFLAVGIIDDDKIKNKIYNEFKICKETEKTNFLLNDDKFLIVIKKATEDWIDNVCREIKINRSNFGLPDNFNEFLKITKKQLSNDSKQKIKNLLKAILNKKDDGYINNPIIYLVRIFRIFSIKFLQI